MLVFFIYALAPYILFIGGTVAAVIICFWWPRTLMISLPVIATCIGWFYLEANAGNWQMDELCRTKAGQFIFRREFGVSTIHERSNDYCLACYDGLVEYGFTAIEFTVESSWTTDSVRALNVERGKSYRATLQPATHAACRHRFSRHYSLSRKFPGQCLAVEEVANVTAPITIERTERGERRFLGRIETSRTAVIRNSDRTLLSETNSYVWRSSGPLAAHQRNTSLTGVGYAIGEYSCLGQRSSKGLDEIVSPKPAP